MNGSRRGGIDICRNPSPFGKKTVSEAIEFVNVKIGDQKRIHYHDEPRKAFPMSTSEAKNAANKLNATHSTGPKTEAGKEKSRRNAVKHGMTGAGVVMPETDAREVDRRTIKFADELMAIGEVGMALARSAALNSFRMERSADQQTASLNARIRQVTADFAPPDDVDEAGAAKLRSEAIRSAMFDPSKEAILARQYQAAAERGFFRALKELRQMERHVQAMIKADKSENVDAMVGSFLESQKAAQRMDEEFASQYPELKIPTLPMPSNSAYPASVGRQVDVPITMVPPR